MFSVQHTSIPGVILLTPQIKPDSRGSFVKTVHADFFKQHGMRSDFVEQYYTISGQNVIRGMHFQKPPADHAKLVTCISGQILDVVVDLRVGSPTYRQCLSFELTANVGALVYIPIGCAHGFLSQSEASIVLYNVTSVYSPEHDTGVLWNSIGFKWPVLNPILSDRDTTFARLDELPAIF